MFNKKPVSGLKSCWYIFRAWVWNRLFCPKRVEVERASFLKPELLGSSPVEHEPLWIDQSTVELVLGPSPGSFHPYKRGSRNIGQPWSPPWQPDPCTYPSPSLPLPTAPANTQTFMRHPPPPPPPPPRLSQWLRRKYGKHQGGGAGVAFLWAASTNPWQQQAVPSGLLFKFCPWTKSSTCLTLALD